MLLLALAGPLSGQEPGPAAADGSLGTTNAPGDSAPAPAPESTTPPSPFHATLTFDQPVKLVSPVAPPPPEMNAVVPSGRDQSDQLGAHLLVVYNQNDPDSQALATYYAGQRSIPPERVLGIRCSTAEEISRTDYDTTVREPIVSYLVGRNWLSRRTQPLRVGDRAWTLLIAERNDIWAIVLMRGVPLKIAFDPAENGTMQAQQSSLSNAAAVDSELSMLPIYGLPPGGYVFNPVADIPGQAPPMHIGPQLARRLVLVTRLDGPTPRDVRRMIDDSIYAERNRLAGLAVIDSRGRRDPKDGYTQGDQWLRGAHDQLGAAGWLVRFDEREDVLPAIDPINQVALYLGWYAENANGPWTMPPNRFVRGAVAYHLHSFSAETVRSPTARWVGPLIAHGAAATMGTVYEPYLDLTPHLDVFTHHLLAGEPFALAAYSSLRAVSWMDTVVGDPLYRPFRLPLDQAIAQAQAAGPRQGEHADWLLLQRTAVALAAGTIPRESRALRAAIEPAAQTGVGQEGLGDLLASLNDSGSADAVAGAYRKALTLDLRAIDQIRAGLKLARYDSAHDRDGEAERTLRQLRETQPLEAVRFGVDGASQPAPPVLSPSLLAPARTNSYLPVPLNRTPGSGNNPGKLPRPPGPPRPP